jgi:serine/threonine protein kinase
MSVATSNEFLESLRKSGLLEEALIEKKVSSYSGDGDPQKLAEYLIQQKVLTNFQARSLLAGRYKGLVIGPYRILDKIGQGGMGIVYLAEHEKLQRRVAIKILPEDKTKDKLALERFYREARAAAALDHQNIVKAHDVCEYNGLHFLVMEYIDGANLQKYVDTKGPLPWKTALNIVIQSCRGLQHAHERNMVHRDIKPGNILVDKSGQVKILDLGLARSFEQKKDNLTQDLSDGKDVMGSIDYISPEQAIGSEKIDIRADIYSLGATLYTLVTGRPPVEGTTAQKLIQHQLKQPPLLHKLNPEIPPEVSQAVLKMLAKKPDQRYSTPADVVAALTPFVLSNSQLIPNAGSTSGAFSKGAPNEVQLDMLPVANLLTDFPASTGSTPIPKQTSPSGPLTKKTKKFKKKKVRQDSGSMVLLLAGVAVLIFAVVGTIWLIMSLGGNKNQALQNNPNQSQPLASAPFAPLVKPTATKPPAATNPPKLEGIEPRSPTSDASTPPNVAPTTPSVPIPTTSFGPKPSLNVGMAMPNISAPDWLEGDKAPIHLADYKGKVILLIFWTFEDPASQNALRDFRAIYDRMKARPFVMLGVNMDSSPAVTMRWVQRSSIPWRNMTWRTSTERNLTDEYSISRGLSVYIVDDKGVIRYRKRGSSVNENIKELTDTIYEQVKKAETGR